MDKNSLEVYKSVEGYEGYLAMLELEEINESWESSSEVYECNFFCKHL